MRDNFDKEFGDIEWMSDAELRKADGKRRISEASKSRAGDPTFIANCKAAQQAKWKDPEYAAKMTATLVACTQDPERNKKVSDSKKQYWKDPDNLKQQSINAKNNWKDPEYVEKVMAHQRIEVTTPYGEFISQAEFGRQTNKNFKDMQKEMPHLYYVTADGPGEVTTQKYLVTPLGEYRNKVQAFKAHVDAGELYTKGPLTQKGSPWSYQKWWDNVSKNKSDLFYTATGPRREWDLK